jgi:hypothetical protein
MPVLGRRVFILLALLMNASVWGAAPGALEYQLKAVFLFNFTQFVEWPPSAFNDSHSPVTICVLGNDPFGTYLDEAVQEEKVNGRSLVVARLSQSDDVSGCHVLFISRSEAAHLKQLLKQLNGQRVLTVSDIEGFAEQGGVIGFFTLENKIRLRINMASAKRADLTISSKLLRPAEIVAAATE